VALVDDLFDSLVFELEGVFRSLHLLFSISVLISYLFTDLGGIRYDEERPKRSLGGLFPVAYAKTLIKIVK
jgi:hypothetical protein